MIKNMPPSAGDTGPVPGLGRFHMPGHLHPFATTAEPFPRALALPQEK